MGVNMDESYKETLNYECPCCGAPLEFDSETQMMKCPSCKNTYAPELIRQNSEDTDSAKKESGFSWEEYKSEHIEGTVVYTCGACGGEIIGDANTAVSRCPYCDSVAVMTQNISGMLKPDYVIPFQKTKEDAKNALKAFYKGKKLLPDSFEDENRIDEINGMYVPFWLFDCDADAKIMYDAIRVTTRTTRDYRYTRTSHFNVIREGTLGFSGIPVDGSSKITDEFMDSIEPFDYSKATPFEPEYLAGYMADKFDVDASDSLPRANERVKNSTMNAFYGTVKGYTSFSVKNASVNSVNGKISYALLPVWMLNTKYNGKTYTFVMNGQTGKLAGSLPIDKKKYIKRLFITAAAIAAPLIGIIILTGGIL